MPDKQMPSNKPHPADETPQVVNLVTSHADEVQADLVRLHRSSARRIEAEELDLHQSSVAQIVAGQVTAHETVIGMAQTDAIHAVNSGVGAVRAEVATVGGNAGTVFAGTAHLQNTYAGVVAGREVRAEHVRTFVLLSPHVEGNVHTVMSTREAILAGVIGGLLTGLVMLLGRFLFRGD